MAQAISGEDSIGQLTAAVFSNPALLSAGSMVGWELLPRRLLAALPLVVNSLLSATPLQKLGFLVNELRSPGIRAAERVQQLVNIATDIGAVTGCVPQGQPLFKLAQHASVVGASHVLPPPQTPCKQHAGQTADPCHACLSVSMAHVCVTRSAAGTAPPTPSPLVEIPPMPSG